MTKTDSYDDYADQLLNNLFENVKKATPSTDNLLLNQLLKPNLPLAQSPPINNEWLLLKQLQQQNELLEKLTATILPKEEEKPKSFKVPLVQPSFPTSEDPKPVKEQKIPRVPIQKTHISLTSPIPNTTSPLGDKKNPTSKGFSKPTNQSKKESSNPVLRSQQVKQKPSFWRPREERPKGWWKGKTTAPVEEEVSEKKKVIAKKVIQPKKVSSLKKPQRQMAFKSPSLKKKKNKVNSKSSEQAPTPVMAVSPIYYPQQPVYYPQQPMMQQPMMQPQYPYGIGNGYYISPATYSQPSEETPTTKTKVKPNPTILNPREASNDKCSIM